MDRRDHDHPPRGGDAGTSPRWREQNREERMREYRAQDDDYVGGQDYSERYSTPAGRGRQRDEGEHRERWRAGGEQGSGGTPSRHPRREGYGEYESERDVTHNMGGGADLIERSRGGGHYTRDMQRGPDVEFGSSYGRSSGYGEDYGGGGYGGNYGPERGYRREQRQAARSGGGYSGDYANQRYPGGGYRASSEERYPGAGGYRGDDYASDRYPGGGGYRQETYGGEGARRGPQSNRGGNERHEPQRWGRGYGSENEPTYAYRPGSEFGEQGHGGRQGYGGGQGFGGGSMGGQQRSLGSEWQPGGGSYGSNFPGEPGERQYGARGDWGMAAQGGGEYVRGGQPGEQRDFRGRGPRDYTRSDERLREDICERLTDDPYVDASDIDIKVEGGEVTLSGRIDDRWLKYHVEDVVDRCPGVKEIHNQLSARRAERSEGKESGGDDDGSGQREQAQQGQQAAQGRRKR